MKTFDIPTQKYQSTGGARRAYAAFWGAAWGGSDAALRALAALVPSSNDLKGNPSPFDGSNSRCRFMLWLMRENGGGR